MVLRYRAHARACRSRARDDEARPRGGHVPRLAARRRVRLRARYRRSRVHPEPGSVRTLRGLPARRGVERANLEAELLPIPGADQNAVQLIRDIDGDGDPDELHFFLEVVEIQEEVYPGEFVTFWVFAPMGTAMTSPARLPSPTLRVETGDIVEITLCNTHYLPHTIHLHGTSQPTTWTACRT